MYYEAIIYNDFLALSGISKDGNKKSFKIFRE